MRSASNGGEAARMNCRIAQALQDATPGRVMADLTNIWLAQEKSAEKDAFVLALIGTFGAMLGKASTDKKSDATND
jgi:hypothetical protein